MNLRSTNCKLMVQEYKHGTEKLLYLSIDEHWYVNVYIRNSYSRSSHIRSLSSRRQPEVSKALMYVI